MSRIEIFTNIEYSKEIIKATILKYLKCTYTRPETHENGPGLNKNFPHQDLTVS